MVRDDLYITVPTFFRCPISLDVMKSPVSLCTGVTYDRASIQRWLDGGHNTCPATMQVLQSKEFVPNHTLQRLIQIWSESVQQRQQQQKQQQERQQNGFVDSVPSRDEIKCVIKCMNQTRKESEEANYDFVNEISKIVCFAKESDGNREYLAKFDGFLPMLVEFLGDKRIEFVEQVVGVLDMILNKIGDYQQLMTLLLKKNNNNNEYLNSLLFVLQKGSANSRVAAVRVFELIAIDAESKLLIAEKDELLLELVKSIGLETDPTLIEASLSCLITISMSRRVRIKLVHLSIVTELQNLLTAQSSSVSIMEKSLKLLETASSCKEGRAEMCRDRATCVEAVLQKVLKVSAVATEHAVTILWSVCYLFGDQTAQETVIKSNGMTKILLLMQSNCSPAVRQMCADLLKVFRVGSKSCLPGYDTLTTHIMPF